MDKEELKQLRRDNLAKARETKRLKGQLASPPSPVIPSVEANVIPSVETKKQPLKTRGISLKSILRWSFLLPSVGLIYLGGWAGMAWGADHTQTILAFGSIGIPLGAALGYWVISKRETDSSLIVIEGGEPRFKGVANSLNIYAEKDKATGKIRPLKVAFEWVERPLGQPYKCLNNDGFFYVHLWNIAKQCLEPFILPDSQYFDPDEFANVLQMPAHRKLFAQQVSMFQKIAIWALVLALGISGIILLVVMG